MSGDATAPPAKSAGDFDYESLGADYSAVRRTDPRIAQLVHHGLGTARSVVNVGAGAGSYEPSQLRVAPVEPSGYMRSLRPPDLSRAVNAVGENLPFLDASFDASMAMVTVHQWGDPERGLRELRRVSRGPVVILTFDGDALDDFWLAHYVPELIAAERRRYPAIDHICDVLGGATTVTTVPIPIDCTDGFTEAFYARPERFLDPAVRRSQSAWGFVPPDVAHRVVEQLRGDLARGAWDRRYGSLRALPEFHGSLRLIVATP
jgi:SAM-dependent methyltransferase